MNFLKDLAKRNATKRSDLVNNYKPQTRHYTLTVRESDNCDQGLADFIAYVAKMAA